MAYRLLRTLAPVATLQYSRSIMNIERLLNLSSPVSSEPVVGPAAASTVVAASMSGFNLLHLVTKNQPAKLKACGLPSGTSRAKKTWPQSFSQEELRKRLTPMQYHITQEKGTESAFRGEYTDHKEEGTYRCVVCGAPLFASDKKFDSGSGWPSFFDLINEESVSVTDDFSYGMHRVETSCSQCGAHLGHLFDDGPRPTGKRYCINSASLTFQPKNVAPEGAEPSATTGQSSSSSSKTEL